MLLNIKYLWAVFFCINESIYMKKKNPILRNLYKVVNLFQVVTPQFLVDNGLLQVQLYT